MKSSTNTSNCLVLSAESTTREQVQVSTDLDGRRPPRNRKNVENAIYSYIRAIRALGRKEINIVEVANALSLPIAEVNHAVSSLRKKGVKRLNA
jgi:predicted transcriptional regulator